METLSDLKLNNSGEGKYYFFANNHILFVNSTHHVIKWSVTMANFMHLVVWIWSLTTPGSPLFLLTWCIYTQKVEILAWKFSESFRETFLKVDFKKFRHPTSTPLLASCYQCPPPPRVALPCVSICCELNSSGKRGGEKLLTRHQHNSLCTVRVRVRVRGQAFAAITSNYETTEPIQFSPAPRVVALYLFAWSWPPGSCPWTCLTCTGLFYAKYKGGSLAPLFGRIWPPLKWILLGCYVLFFCICFPRVAVVRIIGTPRDSIA